MEIFKDFRQRYNGAWKCDNLIQPKIFNTSLVNTSELISFNGMSTTLGLFYAEQ